MKNSFAPSLRSCRNRAIIMLAAICLVSAANLPLVSAAQDCQEYWRNARAVPGQSDCMARCVSGSKGLGNNTCGNHCRDYCNSPAPRQTVAPPRQAGGTAKEDCEKNAEHYINQADRNIDEWEQDIAEGERRVLSEDDLAILRAVADQFLSGLRGFLIERAGSASGLDTVFVNSGHIADIVNADNSEERFLASLNLGFALLSSFIPQGGSPESAGVKIDEIRRDLGEYITALKDPESLRAFARKQYERKREACSQIPIELPPYEPKN